MHSRREKKDEEDSLNTFASLDKAAVLQEARSFNNNNLNAKKCIITLSKILAIINRGDRLNKAEATDAFFAMTKLFQSKDVNLRRVLYIVIKEMADIADDVIIVTSSLTKDMTGPEIQFRAPAIRALCKITDASMLPGIERFMKQSIVDKSGHIASAALVSSIHLISGRRGSPSSAGVEIIRRWANEIQEAANSSSERPMVQYHALGLLYLIKRVDRLSVMKIVAKFTGGGHKSPLAHCFIIRIAAKQLEDEGFENNSALTQLLESSLRNKSELVNFEAARAIVNLSQATARDLAPAISVLQLFCSNHKPALKYAAVRTLSQVAMRHPSAVQTCNLDLEQLITDSNRSIATLAITTLLKTGNEASVERLLKQIASFMNDISDEFKIIVVESCRSLTVKYPRKVTVMVNFLSGLLRNNGGYKFKKAVVAAIEFIIVEIPDAKNSGLMSLCEFIEDCDHLKLTQRVLYLLGKEGPGLKSPRKFIRYIYNRIMLESAPIRCTGTTALARFGALNQELRPSILVLLQRIMQDEDDEVRDRAAFFHTLLREAGEDAAVMAAYIVDGMEASPAGLERALLQYTGAGSFDTAFDLRQVPLAPAAPQPLQPLSGHSGAAPASIKDSVQSAGSPGLQASTVQDSSVLEAGAARQLNAADVAFYPELGRLGPLFRSSAPIQLSEPETEYVVRLVKHMFPHHCLLEYTCHNTMEDQLLDQVHVAIRLEEGSAVRVVHTLQAREPIGYNCQGRCYLVLKFGREEEEEEEKEEEEEMSVADITANFTNTLHFVVRDPAAAADAGQLGAADEYPLEDAALELSDHFVGVVRPNFGLSWEELGADCQAEETFVLDRCNTLEETVRLLLDHLGLKACERSDKVVAGKSSHKLLLAGVFRGGFPVLAVCKLVNIPSQEGVSLHMSVRCAEPAVRAIVLEAVG